MTHNPTKVTSSFMCVLGTLRINYMMDLQFGRIDEITFNTFNIRNRGQMIMNNEEFQHRMFGNSMQVGLYP